MKEILGKYKLKLATTVILTIIATCATLWQPHVISDITTALNQVDSLGNVNVDQDVIMSKGIMLVALGVITLVASVITAIIGSDLAQSIGTELREREYRKIQTFAAQDIDKFNSSNLVVRLTNDITQIQNFIVMGIMMVIRIPVMFFGAFILAVWTFPQLWWTIIIYVLVVGLISMLSFKRMGPLFGQIQKGLDKVNTILKENMLGVRVVKSFVTEAKEQERFSSEVNDLTAKQKSVGTTFSFMVPMFMFSANILTALAIYLTAGWAIDDVSLIGSLISFTTYLMQIMFALVMMGMMSMLISRASVSFKRVNEIITTESSMQFGDIELEEIEKIEFRNINFAYEKDEENVLTDVSFDIAKGEKVGIVGLTGSGKSSLVQLIPRIYDISGGKLLINNRPISQYTDSSLRSKIGYVLQKPQLFSGTIADNIRQGKADATEQEMIVAAKAAQAYEFIDTKEGRFEAEVAQMGNNFSGGQKQRLAITRGLVKNPDVLILDDSTSALDARSERLVKEAINELDTAIVMVAQKITSVIDMDKIVVLNEGHVDAIGTHKELLESSSLYNQIYQTQRGKE